MRAALRTAVRGVLGSLATSPLVSYRLLNELHCLQALCDGGGGGARTPVQTSIILCKALALYLWTFIKHGLYLFPISAHLLNDFRVTFSVWVGHNKEWNLPSGRNMLLYFPVRVYSAVQIHSQCTAPQEDGVTQSPATEMGGIIIPLIR